MLTAGEANYLSKIPDDQMVTVKPFNPKGLIIADQIIQEIKSIAPLLDVICIGSLPLQIAGQEDIDINAFCIKSEQEQYLPSLEQFYGKPSRIGQNSVGWSFTREGFSVDVWLTDPTAETTKNQLKVFEALKNDPALRSEYEKLKLEAKDLPYKQYQTKKYEFYHRILGIE